MTKASVLKNIRTFCLQCMGGIAEEVRLCTAPRCQLYIFRFGLDPAPNKAKSDAAKVRQNLFKRVEEA